jgi:hypothetical protein
MQQSQMRRTPLHYGNGEMDMLLVISFHRAPFLTMRLAGCVVQSFWQGRHSHRRWHCQGW